MYCWLLLGLITVPVALLTLVLPAAGGRWQVVRSAARLLARLSGTRIRVHGLEQLAAQGPLILVANHQSYLDSLVLIAALPVRFSFVAKAELAQHAVLRHLLTRLNVAFVERFDTRQALEDTRRLQELAAGGRSLCFFAEGTFRRTPGLRPFHLGAFLVAAENALEVVPITLRGTRNKLRAGSWFPRRGFVHLFIGPRLGGKDSTWESALALRDEARQQILLHCGEPDASGEE